MKSEEKNVVFIPARLTSKRVPGKNIADIGGIPLFAHSVRVANKIKNISKVFVSTDSDEIDNYAIDENCMVLRRDAKVMGYEATNFDIIRDAIPKITSHLNATPDILVLLQPTHPFRSPNEISKALELLRKNDEASSLISVKNITEATGNISSDGCWNGMSSLTARERKEGKQIYQNTGNFYMFRIPLTIEKNELYGDKILAYQLSYPTFDINIDYPHELELARTIQKNGFELLGLDYNPVLD